MTTDAPSRLVTLSTAVMGHPLRSQQLDELGTALAGLAPTLVEDPDPLSQRGTMRTARRTWSAMSARASHHLVLQDDSVPANGLDGLLHELVAAKPDAAICLYADWATTQASLCRLAALWGSSWAPVVDRVPVQGLLLPRRLSAGLRAYLDDETTRWEPYDQAALRYLRSAGAEVVVATPNLLDRAKIPSLMSDVDRPRRSCCFPPPVHGEWSGGTSGVPEVLPHLSWSRGQAILVRTGANRGRAPSRSVLDVLCVRGLDQAELLAAFDADLRGTDQHERLDRAVGGGFLFELWLLGVALAGRYALVGGGVSGTDRVPDPGDPRLWPALCTVAAGGLSRFVDPRCLEQVADATAALLCGGIRHGLAGVDTGRPLSEGELLAEDGPDGPPAEGTELR